MNSDRALELARVAFPNNEDLRVAYMIGCDKGYEVCEEDMTLTPKDIKKIEFLLIEVECSPNSPTTKEGLYGEVLKRFNEWKLKGNENRD